MKTPIDNDLFKQIETMTYQWIAKGNMMYGLFLELPTITLDLKGMIAGKTIPHKWWIRYNYDLLCKNHDEFITNTTAHEVSHLIEWKLYGKCGHKKNWKDIMHRFGFENPCRCHNYKV
jgi:SprT protein